LNNDFYNTLDKSKLVECEYSYGSYGEDTNYDYASTASRKEKGYVSLMTIGDLFISDYNKYWLSNNLKDDLSLSYIVSDTGSFYADYITSSNYVRPVVCIAKGVVVGKGNGMKDNPYILGE